MNNANCFLILSHNRKDCKKKIAVPIQPLSFMLPPAFGAEKLTSYAPARFVPFLLFFVFALSRPALGNQPVNDGVPRNQLGMMGKKQCAVRGRTDFFPHLRRIRIYDLRQEVTGSYKIRRMVIPYQDSAFFIVNVD